MSQYLETLDQREHLGKHWIASVMFHGGVVVMLIFSGFNSNKPNNWGSPNPGGGAMAVSVVKSIPPPPRAGLVNPLANDSKTTVPLPPTQAKPETKVKAPEADATPIPSKKSD